MQVLTRHEVCLGASATERERWRGCSPCAAASSELGAWQSERCCRDHEKRSSEGVERRHVLGASCRVSDEIPRPPANNPMHRHACVCTYVVVVLAGSLQARYRI